MEKENQIISLDGGFIEKPIQAIVSEINEIMEQGFADPLLHFLFIKKIGEVAKALSDNPTYKDKLNSDIESYLGSSKSTEIWGAKISTAEVKDWWYQTDPQLEALEKSVIEKEEALKEAKRLLKEAQEYRQRIKEPLAVIDEESGEIYHINPAIQNPSKKQFRVAFKK